MLQPGETKSYELELEVMYNSRKIETFMQQLIVLYIIHCINEESKKDWLSLAD